jgi:predicted AAA+ superfamily ATPase
VAATYRTRVVDAELERRLQVAGAVVIEGPKACGKTETARQAAASSVLLDIDASARQAAAVDPALILAGPVPRLIDEWQLEPAVWNHVRRAVDDRPDPGQFILTGSAHPGDDASRHTGVGRFSFLRMRPMSLYEAGRSDGSVSLAELMAGEAPGSPDPGLTVSDLAECVVTGGWPRYVGSSVDAGATAAGDYLTQLRQVDIGRLAGAQRDPAKVGRLLRSLARNVATEVAATVLAADAGGADGPLDRHTVADYLDVLERLMVVENQPAWAPHLRSKAILRSSPKRHLVDPSLAAAALSAKPTQLLRDLNLLGFLFESLVVRDLRVFAQPLAGEVFHYRDNNGLEVDAIVALADGRWGAFEIKLGPAMVDAAAAALLRFASIVDISKSGPPAVLGVVCATGYGYRRPDGVCVIPVGALGP